MKTVIEMAREAGFSCLLPDEAMDMIGGVFEGDTNLTKTLERFAALVREDERKEILLQHLSQSNTEQEPCCKDHPDAPHGFDRNASHNADRYVCECESWEPVQQEPVAWSYTLSKPLNTRIFTDDLERVKTARELGYEITPLYTSTPTAAQAAKQMRDAAVKLCLAGVGEEPDNCNCWYEAQDACAKAIAALPILGEEK